MRALGHHVLGALLAAGYIAILLATSPDLAMTRDESFYVVAAENVAQWLRAVAGAPERVLDRDLIDRYWEYNHEHPAWMKLLSGLSWLAQQRWALFASHSAAFRFPGMLTGGLLLWIIYIFGVRVRGPAVGLFSALAFATLPRVFYHSHLNCFDVPIAFFTTWTTYLYYLSLRRHAWVPLLGVVYGLALATKHNAWILPGVLLIHWLWWRLTSPGIHRGWIHVPPWWLVSMVCLGVPVFWLSWPWLWHDGWARWLWYARFHTSHVHYHMAYFGTTHIHPPFPMSYPWVMTAFTIPATTLVLAVFGMLLRVRGWLPAFISTVWSRRAPDGLTAPDVARGGPDANLTDVLWMGSLLAPIVVISLPHTPIFGGTKHWLAAYPFLALFAGVGFSRVGFALLAILQRACQSALPTANTGAKVAAATLCLTPGAVETAHSHPFGLSHYTVLAGHVPGAADLGMNRQFWGFTQGALASWFREAMPAGGTVWPCDATHMAWTMMQRDGMLPENIRAAGSMATADYILVHHEHHFAEVDGQAWVVIGGVAPVKVLSYDGVPMVSVYENPHRRRQN